MAPPATEERPASSDRLPTLTEVVELAAAPAAGLPEAPVAVEAPEFESDPMAQTLVLADPIVLAPAPAVDTAQLIDEVLAALAPAIDALLEARLREALAPVLAQVLETLASGAREALSRNLREMVQQAVMQTLDRQR